MLMLFDVQGRELHLTKHFFNSMNIALPTRKFDFYNAFFLQDTNKVCEASLWNAARETIDENEGSSDVGVAFDGTRQKQGHTSMNGIVTITFFDIIKVFDFEFISKYYNVCKVLLQTLRKWRYTKTQPYVLQTIQKQVAG